MPVAERLSLNIPGAGSSEQAPDYPLLLHPQGPFTPEGQCGLPEALQPWSQESRSSPLTGPQFTHLCHQVVGGDNPQGLFQGL